MELTLKIVKTLTNFKETTHMQIFAYMHTYFMEKLTTHSGEYWFFQKPGLNQSGTKRKIRNQEERPLNRERTEPKADPSNGPQGLTGARRSWACLHSTCRQDSGSPPHSRRRSGLATRGARRSAGRRRRRGGTACLSRTPALRERGPPGHRCILCWALGLWQTSVMKSGPPASVNNTEHCNRNN